MANIITEQKIIDTNNRALLKYVVRFDGTPMANTLLVDVSQLNYAMNTNNKIMVSNTHKKTTYHTTIRRVFGDCHFRAGGSGILQWQSDSNTDILTCGVGFFDYDFNPSGLPGSIPMQNGNGNTTGNILLSNIGPVQQYDVMTILVDLKKDPADYDQGQTADPLTFNTHGI